jgi:hypothetical protein
MHKIYCLLAVLFAVFIFNQPAMADDAIWGLAANESYHTTCAEEDNVNVPLFGDNFFQFIIRATHPAYDYDQDNCNADFSGCADSQHIQLNADTCNKIFDDGQYAVEVCDTPEWWRPFKMQVNAGGNSAEGAYFRIYAKIADEMSWPQFLVLYQDGNMRLIPHPKPGRASVCFGSSVIVGPAPVAQRPFIDIERVDLTFYPLSMKVVYKEGGFAAMAMLVDRESATVFVTPNYAKGMDRPFAVFRSMWVQDGNCDVERIQTADSDEAILGAWESQSSTHWRFYRSNISTHNTSAPDILVEMY